MAHMLVGELRALLADPDLGIADDMIVILASDAEGNSFHPVQANEDNIVYALSTGYYDAESHELLTAPDPDERDSDELENWAWAKEHGVACLALWPVH